MKEEINDNEIRIIIGSLQEAPKDQIVNQVDNHPPKIHRARVWVLILTAMAVISIIAVITVYFLRIYDKEEVALFEPEISTYIQEHPLKDWLYSYDSIGNIAGCVIKDTTVNDIAIRIYYPVNVRAALQIGTQCLDDSQTVLAFQAADIRADNMKIVGAFVEKGKPIAWGLSKKGYCAIIEDVITVGMADNSPLFEEATYKEGYFFRQYPLVADGKPQHSELRSQTIRRSLCDIDEHIVVIETQDRASMHDFSLLLSDIGVNNAIYLIGSDAYGVAMDTDGNKYKIGTKAPKVYKYINYIYWSKS